ncbi:MAG: HAD family phosphatase [Treponema sp.]|nr:HAD family phosphatase [Treponema sp.]
MQIKAVAFDYGKVICMPPDGSVWKKIASLAGIGWDVIDPVYRRYRLDYDRGKFDAAGFYKKIMDELRINVDDDQTLKAMGELDLGSWKNINPQTVRLMEELKNSCLLVAILSNMPYDFLSQARKQIPVFSLPQISVFSCEAGAVKPEKEIYQFLLGRLKCRAGEVVFFDDLPENIEGAAAVGINARLWVDIKKARGDLRELGINLN